LEENYQVIDYYYSKFSMSKIKKMSYKNLLKNSFLLRKIRDKENKFYLVYKDKILKNDEVVLERKIKINISNFENAIEIFNSANLTNWCYVYDDIFSFRKDNIILDFEIIKDLGIFIEYEEGEDLSSLKLNEKRKLMIERLKSLGLKLGNDYSCKKVFMLLHKD